MDKSIYKEAILDAKAIRASAIANAKATLQEAIEPKIQEMMRLKLSEELEESELEEGTYEEGMKHGEMEEDAVTEASLDEILAELDSMEEGKKEEVEEGKDEEKVVKEAEEDEESGDEEEASDEEGDEASEEGGDEEGEGEEITDDTEVMELTVGELKDMLQSVMAGEEQGEEDLEADVDMGGEEGGEEAGAEGGEEGEETVDEISLDEILAELEEGGGTDLTDPNEKLSEKKEEMEEGKGHSGGVYTKSVKGMKEAKKDKPEDKVEEGKGHSGGVYTKSVKGVKEAKKEDKKDELEEVKNELEEAKRTIGALRENMQEINLLNAKLLYMNKLFKAKSLNESEKVKVIKAFDRAVSVREVKNTYETLKESLSVRKSTIKESIGFASKPIGSAQGKGNIVESNDFVSRWQKIAGIK